MTSPSLKWPLTAVAICVLALAPTAFAGDEDDRGPASLLGIDLDLDTPLFRVGTEAALFERPRYGGESRLYVREDDGRVRVFRGENYARIVERNPSLGAHAGLEVLGQKLSVGGGISAPETEAKVDYTPVVEYRVARGNMTYVKPSDASMARIYVREGDKEYVYAGDDFDTIVKTYPAITKMESYTTLQSAVNASQASSISISTEPAAHVEMESDAEAKIVHPHYVNVMYEPNTVNLELWRYENGKWNKRTWQGESLAAICEKIHEEDPALHSTILLELRENELDEDAPAAPRGS